MSILDIEKLGYAIDRASGCAVLYNEAGEIKLIVPHGKMRIEKLGDECSDCMREGLAFAKHVSAALYVADVSKAGKPVKPSGCSRGGA